MSDNSTGKKEIKTVNVNDEVVNEHIKVWAGDGRTIVVDSTYTYFKDNVRETNIENNTTSGNSSTDSTGNTTGSVAVVEPNENGKFSLDQVKEGMYISAVTVVKGKDLKENKENKDEEKSEGNEK